MGLQVSAKTRTPHTDLARAKLVIFIGHFGRGGCERQAFLLAQELRRRHGISAEVWALSYDGHNSQYAEEFETAGVPTKVLGFRYPIFSRQRFTRGLEWLWELQRVVAQLKKDQVDILLPFTTWPNVVAGLSYRRAGVQLCIWGERHCGGERIPTPERIAVRRYRRFVANSTAGAEFLASEMRVPRERISYVPNGVEEPKASGGSNWRSRLGLTAEQPLIVKVANFTVHKDHATLLRAWKTMQDAWSGGERPVLALAGICLADWPYDLCRKIVAEAGLGPTVRFLGSISDVPGLIEASDLAAFSSRKEGMPNAVLECMAAGKAVVASDLPGIRDALGSNAGEVIVPPGDHNRFAQVLLNLLRNKDKRDELGGRNRARIRDEFSVGRMTERHLNIILKNLRPLSS